MVHLNFEGGIELIELLEGGLQKGASSPLREFCTPEFSNSILRRGLKGGLRRGASQGDLRRVSREA